MSQIQESSRKVSKIIKAIDEIALQTDILALNAAVEAARAGETGLGFAVVAEEVKNLAYRCAQAAKETTTLIEESISNANQGHLRLARVSESIASITSGVSEARGRIAAISESSQQQASGLKEVLRSIEQIEHTTKQTAASARQAASSSHLLRIRSATSMELVGGLKKTISGQESGLGGRRSRY